MKRFHWFFLIIFSSIIFGCSSFPSKQLSFDLTKETIPVMFNQEIGSETVKSFIFEASYSKVIMTSQGKNNNNNGGTGTSTMMLDQNVNKPIGEQIGNIFIQNPLWMSVSKFEILDDHSIKNFLFVSVDKLTYKTTVELQTPIAGEKK
jgi:hypothetical protein